MDTVADLIRSLQQMPQDLPVMKAKDEEGNGFSQIGRVQVEKYLADVPRNSYNLSIVNQQDIDGGEYGDNPEIGEVVILW
jgi:hypothetical protein